MNDLFDLCDNDTPTNITSVPLIGDAAPNFSASTTNGPIQFTNDFAGKWIVFFSHPSDFTPVCTSEFIAFQREIDEFEKLNVYPNTNLKNLKSFKSKIDEYLCEIGSRWKVVSPHYCINCINIIKSDEYSCTKL